MRHKWIAILGLCLVLAPVVVECWAEPMGWGAVWRHQLRWARTYRICRPAGYLAYGITHALFYSLVILLSAGLAPWIEIIHS